MKARKGLIERSFSFLRILVAVFGGSRLIFSLSFHENTLRVRKQDFSLQRYTHGTLPVRTYEYVWYFEFRSIPPILNENFVHDELYFTTSPVNSQASVLPLHTQAKSYRINITRRPSITAVIRRLALTPPRFAVRFIPTNASNMGLKFIRG